MSYNNDYVDNVLVLNDSKDKFRRWLRGRKKISFKRKFLHTLEDVDCEGVSNIVCGCKIKFYMIEVF